MHLLSFLCTIFVALCFINAASASIYGVDCECDCCISRARAECTPTTVGSIHLNSTVCDTNQCITACNNVYPLCESGQAVMQASCTDTTSGSSTTTQTTTVTWTTATQSPSVTTSTSTKSVTSTSSTSTSTTPQSNGNAIKSIFQLSHFVLSTVVLTFLCL